MQKKHKDMKVSNSKSCFVWGMAFVLGVSFLPAKAFAGCEMPWTASYHLGRLDDQTDQDIEDYTTQEENFITEILTNTATYEMSARLEEFDTNIRRALDWWWEQLLPAMKRMTAQLSTAQIDQTRAIGSMIDAQLMDEGARLMAEKQREAHQRYAPSEAACQIDSVGPGQNKAFHISRALNRGLSMDDTLRRGNTKGTISDAGRGQEKQHLWQEYKSSFCDNTAGDQGCTSPGATPGAHKDIPGMLWGDKQTIDASNSQNVTAIQAALRYLIYPFSSDPIMPTAVDSVNGHYGVLYRRSEEARVNTVYNAVGQMIAERVGGSGVDTQAMRVSSGIPAGQASNNASYREIQEALTKDRFTNPQAIVRMIEDPAQMGRQQQAFNILRLQIMNDIYRRSEEMLFMAAAEYGRDLDKQMPSSAKESTPLK